MICLRILVTGATGFIGKRLVEAMSKRGYRVTCFVRKTSDISLLKKSDVRFFYGDILDKGSIEKALDENEIIIHLVGLQSFSEYSKKIYKTLYATNVLGLKNLLDAIVAKKPKRLRKIIFVSSTAVVGLTKGKVDESVTCRPISPYQITKYRGEKLCLGYVKQYRLPIVILRPSMVYGTKDDHSQLQKMVKLIKKGFFPVIGNGNNVVPIIYIDDVVNGVIQAALKAKVGEIYYLTNDNLATMNDIVSIISNKLKVRVFKIKIPVFIMYPTLVFFELFFRMIGKEATISRRRILSMSSNRVFDVSKAKRDFGFKPKISAEEGIGRAIETYEKNKKS